MIGNFWTNGVGVYPNGRGKFWATVKFYDSGFCEDGSTEGELHTRYAEPLEQAIDTVIADAKHMGIVFKVSPDGTADWSLYISGGDNDLHDPLSEELRKLLREQATRLGCHTY